MKTGLRPKYEIALPSGREIVLTRWFDAPRELVFRAHLDPELIPLWWGPRGNTTVVDRLEARPGGSWRFTLRQPDGKRESFHGEFREIVAPERFSWTFIWEGLPDSEGVEHYLFEELNGKTRLTSTSFFGSVEERDGVIASGMEVGANESADRLDELLERLQT